jgi:hypothetical protein
MPRFTNIIIGASRSHDGSFHDPQDLEDRFEGSRLSTPSRSCGSIVVGAVIIVAAAANSGRDEDYATTAGRP